MKLITDLKTIKRLSKERKEENWRFQLFIKDSPRFDDQIFNKIVTDIKLQIDCTSCANCCKVISSRLSDKDIKRMCHGLRLSNTEFKKKYPIEGLELKDRPCKFLQNNRCTIYNLRPDDCREFPGLENISTRSLAVFWNIEICPIIFNVRETAKQYFWNHW